MLMFSTLAALWLRWSSPVSHEQLQELQYVKKAHSLRSTKSLHRWPLFTVETEISSKRHCWIKLAIRSNICMRGKHFLLLITLHFFSLLPTPCLLFVVRKSNYGFQVKKRKKRKTRKVRLPHEENKWREMKGNGGVWRISESLLVSCHCVWFGGNQKLFIKIAANLLVGVCADCLATSRWRNLQEVTAPSE